jgi:hypothetical protein
MKRRVPSAFRRLGLSALACACSVMGPAAPRCAQTPEASPGAFMAVYRQANPLVNWSFKEIHHQIPELKHLEPSDDQSVLPQILSRVASNVAGFISNALNTTSIETIDQTRIFGRTLNRRQSVTVTRRFNYLMVVRPGPEPGAAQLDEYRTDLHNHKREYDAPSPGFFVTIGFASMPLSFSRRSQQHSAFRYLGTERFHKRRTLVVAFSNRADPAAVMGRFIDGNTSVPMLIQGVAWIDPQSYQIERMRTDLLAPQPSIRLEGVTTKVEFSSVAFRGAGTALWLPKQVNVDVYLDSVVYSNRHRYKNYEVFRVDTRQDSDDAKPGAP